MDENDFYLSVVISKEVSVSYLEVYFHEIGISRDQAEVVVMFVT